MLQRINNIINTSYETNVSKRDEDILSLIREGIGNSKWHSPFTGGYVNFNEFKINGNKIEILRTPGVFSAFKAYGRIILHLTKTERQDLTRIKCEIQPGDNSLPYVFAFVLLLFLLWIMMLVFIEFIIGMAGLAPIIIGSVIVFCITILLLYIKYRIARVGLTDYSDAVIKLIKR